MPRGRHRAETQSETQVERNWAQICTRKGERERRRKKKKKDRLGRRVCACVFHQPLKRWPVPPGRNSWRGHEYTSCGICTSGSGRHCSHTTDTYRNTQTHMCTRWVRANKKNKKHSAVKEGQRVCQSGGKCHAGNEFRSQVGTCCCCALAIGTVSSSCWAKFSLHIFSTAIY